jgi:hypothetical protein
LRAYRHVGTVTAVLTTLVAVDGECSEALAMSLSFSWTGVARCSSSPLAFTLSDVSPGNWSEPKISQAVGAIVIWQ